MDDKKIANASAAAGRLMRAYHGHCTAPDLDSLFGLLEAAHSASDRLGKAVGVGFIDVPEFLALKSLRNYFHHHEELRHAVRVIPVAGLPIQTDF